MKYAVVAVSPIVAPLGAAFAESNDVGLKTGNGRRAGCRATEG